MWGLDDSPSPLARRLQHCPHSPSRTFEKKQSQVKVEQCSCDSQMFYCTICVRRRLSGGARNTQQQPPKSHKHDTLPKTVAIRALQTSLKVRRRCAGCLIIQAPTKFSCREMNETQTTMILSYLHAYIVFHILTIYSKTVYVLVIKVELEDG